MFKNEVIGGSEKKSTRTTRRTGRCATDSTAATSAALRQVVGYLAARNANFPFGTDARSAPTYGNLPGLNGYLEMQQLHDAGLSLKQIFKAATIDNPREFKLDSQVGSIDRARSPTSFC